MKQIVTLDIVTLKIAKKVFYYNYYQTINFVRGVFGVRKHFELIIIMIIVLFIG